MKTAFVLTGLVAFVAAQKAGTAPKGKGTGSTSSLLTCVTGCASGITGIPCQDKLPPMDASSLSGIMSGKIPDITPFVTCACADAKIDSALKCVNGCGGFAATIAGPIITNKGSQCANPKAVQDQLASAVAGLSSYAGGKGAAPKASAPKTPTAPKGKGGKFVLSDD